MLKLWAEHSSPSLKLHCSKYSVFTWHTIDRTINTQIFPVFQKQISLFSPFIILHHLIVAFCAFSKPLSPEHPGSSFAWLFFVFGCFSPTTQSTVFQHLQCKVHLFFSRVGKLSKSDLSTTARKDYFIALQPHTAHGSALQKALYSTTHY